MPTLNAKQVERTQVYGFQDLKWRGDALMLGGRSIALLVRDPLYGGMWRVSVDGHLSDIVNETRARDAAVSLALGVLNRTQETALDAPPVELSGTEPAPC
jgi:hypothetical protein